jgi:NitT/TauT family transport system substrate-binding protein
MTLAALAVILAVPAFWSTVRADEVPSFSLAWSEYPSWSAFGVAHEFGFINGREGEMGPIEKKWGVDIVLKEADYDTCLVMYGSGKCDAVCITNMDALIPCLTRKSVGILPTSTSFGADACIVDGSITDIKQLRGKKVYGLAKTVSEYCFVRNVEILGEKEADYRFTNMDPAAAALAMQQKRDGFDAIVVWNPFVLETLNKRKDARVLFDSTTIPGEIIDMVVMTQEALDKPGGDKFAWAVIDAFYTINQEMAKADTRDETLIALGEKFSNLDLNSMRKVVKQTRFYSTPEEGIQVLGMEATAGIMEKVVAFCVSHEIVPKAPEVGFGSQTEAKEAAFRLDPTYIKGFAAKSK